MERTFNTYKSTSEKILIESVNKETGITTSITVEPEAYAVLAEYFKQCAVAESSDKRQSDIPDVTQQRKLLIAYTQYMLDQIGAESSSLTENMVDGFLGN